MKTAAIAAHSATKLGRKIARTLIFMVILASYKVEYGQLLEMAPAFGVRLLGTALVVISGFYRFPRQRTRVDFLSDHCRRIEVHYQSGSKQPHSKGSADPVFEFSFLSSRLDNFAQAISPAVDLSLPSTSPALRPELCLNQPPP